MGTPLQDLLPLFLNSLIERLQIENVIFAGGSGGGFAALYYSWCIRGSTAVVTMPQTNLHKYYAPRREAYLQTSWPDGVDETTGSTPPCLDLRTIYSRGMLNTVVYLQSNMDLFHVENHMAPFVSSLSGASLKRLILKCSFWGKLSHSGSVPMSEMEAWITAALSADEQTTESIIMAYHLTKTEATIAPHTSNRNAGWDAPAKALDSTDQHWTAKIAAEMLD